MLGLALLGAVAAGVLMAVQGPTNAALARHSSGLQATAVSFGGGLLVMALGVLLFGKGDMGAFVQAEWWQLLGGLYGACAVFVTTLCVPVLGLALTLTVIMLGQLAMGAAIDGFGLFRTPPVPVGPWRLLGIAVVAVGIVMVYIGRKKQSGTGKPKLGLIALAVLSGAGGAVQSATNASLASYMGSLEATCFSFIVGFAAVALVLLVKTRGRLVSMKGKGIKPWMMIGGLYGAFGIFLNTATTPILGIALLVTAGMLGQLVGGSVIDHFGLLKSPVIKTEKWRVLGMLTIAIGVAWVSYAKMISG